MKAPSNKPTTNTTRQPASELFGASKPPTMPLIPLMRPFNNNSSAAARPMSRPPTSPLIGVKFSTIASLGLSRPAVRTLAGRGLAVALAVLVAPGDELPQGAQVVVRAAY